MHEIGYGDNVVPPHMLSHTNRTRIRSISTFSIWHCFIFIPGMFSPTTVAILMTPLTKFSIFHSMKELTLVTARGWATGMSSLTEQVIRPRASKTSFSIPILIFFRFYTLFMFCRYYIWWQQWRCCRWSIPSLSGGYWSNGSYESQQLPVFNIMGKNSTTYDSCLQNLSDIIFSLECSELTSRICNDCEQKVDLEKLTWRVSTTITD